MTLIHLRNLPMFTIGGLLVFTGSVFAQANPALLQDIERRLGEIEQESAQRNGAQERIQFAIQAVAKRVDEIQKDYDLRLNELEKKIQQLEQRAPAATLGTSPAPVVVSSVSAISVSIPAGISSTDLYSKAFAYLTATQYPQAEAWLLEFTRRYPQDKLADNAFYWLGESRLVQNNPAGAAQAFRDGLKNFPKSPKAADNLLKLGVALQQLNQAPLAKASWDKLIKDFPNSPQAERAKALLVKPKP